jgi:hypothetical protein
MTNYIIEDLVKRRLGLTQNTDIEEIKSGNVKKLYDEIGKSYHMACIYIEKGSDISILSYGMNQYFCNKDCGSIHAETNVINSLPPLKKKSRIKKHLKSINLMVIKTTQTGKIGMSKPCIRCILDMISMPPQKGYSIKKVSYSSHTGDIVHTTLKSLAEDDDYHISKYYKSHNYDIE